MNLPSAEQYLEIVEKKAFGSLASLNHHRFIVNPGTGSYLFYRSARAIVLKSEYREKLYAVRFFLKDDPELFGRYVQVQAYLKDKALPWKIPFEFLDKEFYPALRMEWVESLSLAQYLDQFIDNPDRLTKAQEGLVALSRNLEENRIGHGNLNLQHIRFTREDDYGIRLIDYDAMFIPAFERKHSLSAGTAGFQHPRRLASDFSPTVDRFTFWLLLTALEAFKTDPSLWKNKEAGTQEPVSILFTYRDLASPEQSATFRLLNTYSNPALQFYTEKLIGFCKLNSLAKIEAPELYQTEKIATENTQARGKNISAERPQQHPQPVSRQVAEPPSQVQETVKLREQPPVKKQEPVPANTKPKPAPVTQKTSVAKTSIPVMTIDKPVRRQPQTVVKKKPRSSRTLLVGAIVILVLVAAYFALPKPSSVTADQKTQPPTEKTSQASSPQPVPQPEKSAAAGGEKKPATFTSANLTQFLFQLYHSYNKRDLDAILSRYGNKVQYYDAGGVSKQELRGIIDDLFIKPAYYECQPDLRTLSFQQQDDGCLINITVKETIKPTTRSKTEKYTSALEYRLDKDFHIISEKRVS